MVWIYADLLPFWGGDIDAKVKVHRKPSGSALLSISSISHETKNFSGLHSIAGSKIFLIGGKMLIIHSVFPLHRMLHNIFLAADSSLFCTRDKRYYQEKYVEDENDCLTWLW